MSENCSNIHSVSKDDVAEPVSTEKLSLDERCDLDDDDNEDNIMNSADNFDNADAYQDLDNTQEGSNLEKERGIQDLAWMYAQLVMPISITMLAVAILNKLGQQGESYVTGTGMWLYAAEAESTSFMSTIMPIITFLVSIITLTLIIIALYYYRFMKVLWSIMAACVVSISIFSLGRVLYILIVALNINIDWISFSLFLWNFAITGLISMFYYAPLRLNQFCLICFSVIVAYSLSYFSEWATWSMLIAVSIYDAIAVIAPFGLLRILLDINQSRKEPMPMFIYSTMVDFEAVGGNTKHVSNEDTFGEIDMHFGNTELENGIAAVELDEDGDSVKGEPDRLPGAKLGLGDFIFFSVLVGKVVTFDVVAAIVVSFAVLNGLLITIFIMIQYGRAVPALPVPIGLGLISLFACHYLLTPMTGSLLLNMVIT